MRSAIAATVVLLAVFPLLRGDSPPAKPTIEQLIEQLNDKSFPVRQAAEKAIEEMGPDALPALRKALAAKPSLEVSRRIEKWIPQFELAALSNPKRVTLDVKGQPLQEVIEMIAKQSGYPVALQPDADKGKKPFDFKFERATFWEALDAVCSSAGMIASRDADPKGFQLAFSDKYQPFVHRHGAFRVVGQGFNYSYQQHRSRSNQFGLVPRMPANAEKQNSKQESESESLQFSLQVEAEPRIAVIDLDDVVISEATDDQKQSLLPKANPQHDAILRRHRRWHRRFAGSGTNLSETVQLTAPSKNAKKVAVLKGTIAIELEKEKKLVVLAEKVLEAKGKKIELGKMTVVIDEVKKGEDQEYDLHLTITGGSDGGGALDGELKLVDDKGNAYQNTSSSSTGNGKRTKLRLSFIAGGAGVGPPTKLAYETRVTVKYALPFEFRDLPLP